ncbi:hypothetical protein PENTCL1PPCAC_16990, partial [Pristionchus entomophagus]
SPPIASQLSRCDKTTKKRPDIQGLRGISIIAVILFHINKKLCPRGFLGVDIFFVISGFLISSILTREPFLTTISISHFYSRRFTRIVPLYVLTLLITLAFAIWILAPLDLREVIHSTKWAAIFAKNIQQILELGDYWTQASEFAPLLHSWSLSVEVQFYLFAPLLQYLISSIQGAQLRLVFTLAITSASLFHYGFPNGSSRFFSLPCRLWQFTTG